MSLGWSRWQLLLIGVTAVIVLLAVGFAPASNSVQSADTISTGVVEERSPAADTASRTDDTEVESTTSDGFEAPRQPEVVSVEQSPREGVNLSVGESATLSFELTAKYPLTEIAVSATDPLGISVDAKRRSIDRLDTGETYVYEIVVTADRSVSRTLDIVVEATNGDEPVTQRIPYSVDATEQSGNGSAAGTDGTSQSNPAVGESTDDSTSTNNTTSSITASSSPIVVSGQAAYTDTDGNVFGLTDVAIRLYDVDGGSTLLATGSTGQDGSFQFAVEPSSDADGDGEIIAEVVVVAENDAVYVTDGNTRYSFYAQTGTLTSGESVVVGTDVDSDGSKELVSSGDNAPFQAVDWAYDASEFAATNGVVKTKLPISYPYGDWPQYRYWTDGREQIRLPDRSDYYWDAGTVAHEYGHAVHFQLIDYTILDVGSYDCHAVPSETDPSFALVEGFAEYYEAAVANDPDAVFWGSENIETNQFYDMSYTGRCANGDASGEYDGGSVEGSVASILWDITDGGAGDDDPLSYQFATIAAVLEHNPADINQFYQIWDNGHVEALDSIYTTYGIDKEPPTVEPALQSSPYTDSSVALSGSVDDEAATEILEIRIDGGAYSTVATSDGAWSATRTLENGTHTVTFRVTDVNGNTKKVSRTIRVSSAGPTATVDQSQTSDFGSPNGSVSVGISYQMRYPSTASVRILDDGSVVATKSVSSLEEAPTGTVESVSVQLPDSVTDGSYDVEVVVTDEAGRTNSTRLDDAVLVDTTAPAIETVTLADSYVNASTPLAFEVGANDSGAVVSGVETVEVVTLETEGAATLSESAGSWAGTVGPNQTAGEHTAVVRVVDRAGNTHRTELSYRVDTDAPTITGRAPRYTNLSEVNVTGHVQDTNLTNVTIYNTDGATHLRNTSGNYTTSVSLDTGTNTLVLVATDAAQNTARHEIAVGVDQTPPEANLSTPGRVGDSPGPPATNDSDPTLVFSVTDDLAEINETAITAKIDGNATASVASRANGTVTVQGSNLSDGTHTVSVNLVDRAGNVRTVDKQFHVDTVRPTIENTTLPEIANLTIEPKDEIAVNVSASDEGTGLGVVSFRDAQLTNESGTWRGNAIAPVRIGNRTLDIRAVDAAGNVQQATVSVYVGSRQTAAVNATGVATAKPSAPEVDSVAVQLTGADGGNTNATRRVELTAAVTDSNPVSQSVPDERVSYYPQFAFNISSNETDGGTFVLKVSKEKLRTESGLAETVTFWLFNETEGTWTRLNATTQSESETSLLYRVETPHYSTFAVSSAVDDTSPDVVIEQPAGDEEIEAGDHSLQVAFSDNESQVLPNQTSVRLDGEPVNISRATVLNASQLRIPISLDSGTHTISVATVDRFGNERTETRNVTVVEPSVSGGGGTSGGGGGQSGQAVETDVTIFERSTTVMVADVSSGSAFEVELTEAANDGVAVESLGFRFTFDTQRFRVEVGDPQASIDDLPEVPSATPITFVDIEAFGLDRDALDSATVTISVADAELPADASRDDVAIYQYAGGEWQEKDGTSLGGGRYKLQVAQFSPIAVVVETPETETPTATPTQTEVSKTAAEPASTATETATAAQTVTKEQIPGFSVVLSLVALLVGALIALRRA